MSYRTSRSYQRNDWPQIAIALLEERSRLVLRTIQLEAEAFSLSAGVCEFRSGNEHGNAMCLATGDLIERMSKEGTRLVVTRTTLGERQRHALNCAGRIDGDCTCDFKSVFGK